MDDALQPLQPLQPLLPLPRHSLGPALWSYLADRPANLLLARRKPDSDTLELAYDYEWFCLHLSVRTMLLSLLCTNSNTVFSYCYPCTSAFFQQLLFHSHSGWKERDVRTENALVLLVTCLIMVAQNIVKVYNHNWI